MSEQSARKHLLIIVHSRSGTNQALGRAVAEGAKEADIEIRLKAPEEADEPEEEPEEFVTQSPHSRPYKWSAMRGLYERRPHAAGLEKAAFNIMLVLTSLCRF